MTGNCTDENFVSWFEFWLEKVLTPTFGSMGIFGNCMAIHRLKNPTLKTTFNQSLVCLAICDILFLVMMIFDQFVDQENMYYILMFPYFWNPFKNILMSLQTFLLMSIAIERFLAVWMPIVYKTKKPSYSGTFHFLLYILPSIALATLVNIPKFLETELVTLTVTDADNTTREVIEYEVTNLRLNENYIFYYTFWTRLLITGAIPFTFLTTMNCLIFLTIKKDIPDYSTFRGKSNVSTTSLELQNLSQKEGDAEEEGRKIPKVNFPSKKSLTLFYIDLIFLICHLPRILLNVYEGKYDVDDPESSPWCTYWINILMSVSIFFLTFNSSVNCLIYYLVWKTFNSVIIRMDTSRHHSVTIA